jgi:hypothetical protein
MGHQSQAVDDYQVALSRADAATIAEAREELGQFAAANPGTFGLDAIEALFASH